MRHRTGSLLALLSLTSALSACAGSGHAVMPEYGPRPDARAEQPTPAASIADEPTPFRLPDGVRPTRVSLALHVDPSAEAFAGRAILDLRVDEASPRIWLHGQGLRVSRVALEDERGTVEGTWTEREGSDGTAVASFPRPVGPGRARLTIDYERPFEEGLDGLYRVAVGDDRYAFTQFEAISARKAFPCFDEPRFKVPFDLTLVVPEGMSAFANTGELESSVEDGARVVRFRATEPLPSYLVAFAVGPFDVVEGTIPPNDVRDRALPFHGLAPRGRGAELAFAMDHTPAIVAALEREFQIAYPFDKLDIVAVPDFGAGAMENPGLVTFRDQLLLLSTDPPVAQERGFAFVMAHELAHMWFGDLVTMAFWDDLWLNEAFATWMETPIVEATFPALEPRTTELVTQLEAFGEDSLASARMIRQPIRSRDDISNAFDGITYSKGASVLAMLEAFVGPERFRDGIRRYLRAHASANATSADFVEALEAAGAPPGTRAILESFTTQAGIPLVRFGAPSCGEGGVAEVPLTQTRYRPLGSSADASPRWTIPVCATYAEAGGTIREACTLLDREAGTLTLPSCPAWVWPNPQGRGYYRFASSPASLAALAPIIRAAIAPSRGAREPFRPGARGGVASTRDLLTLADAIRSSEEAGETEFTTALEALEPMAASEARFVALAPSALYTFASERLVEDRERPRLERRAQRLYAPQLRRLGWGPRRGAGDEAPEVRALRASVLSFLAETARDPAVRREARARGLAFLGEGPRGDHRLHPDALPTDLVDVALVVAASEGDEALFTRFTDELFRSSDGVLRQRLLQGIARFEEPALRDRALELILDPRLRLNERTRLLFALLRNRTSRDAAWAWLLARYDALHEQLGDEASSYLPFTITSFCDREHAEAGRAFFAERAARIVGGPRNLESALEATTLCAERADAERASATRYFSR